MRPETRYAQSGEVYIAYQVVGAGPRDLVFVPGWVSHLESYWDEPTFARVLDRLASFSRLILVERRGTGLSDRVAELPTLEQRMEDVRAVMDAAGSSSATLFGVSEGGPMCALFAATYPERTAGLILCATFARGLEAPDYPTGRNPERLAQFLDVVASAWGTGAVSTILAPSLAHDESARQSWARLERLSVSPGGARALVGMAMDVDVRHVLPVIRVPTLVLHRIGDTVTRIEEARYIAARVQGARLVELPGDDHLAWIGDTEALLGEVEEFLTGARAGAAGDRVLATVLFTDIVGSTARAAELGDQRWRDLLASHHAVVRRELARFQGREVKTTGDGFLATFDGPARAVRCACAIRDAVRVLGIDVRAGLHTGECERTAGDVQGIAVHIGARVAAHAAPGEVLVSGTVRDLVAGSGLRFVDRGTHALPGVPGEWSLLAVDG